MSQYQNIEDAVDGFAGSRYDQYPPSCICTNHFSIAEAKAIGQALMEVAGAIGAQLAPGQVEGEYHASPAGGKS